MGRWEGESNKRGRLTEPDGRDGRLECVLAALLDFGLGLASPRVLLLDELCVASSLLGSLRLQLRIPTVSLFLSLESSMAAEEA